MNQFTGEALVSKLKEGADKEISGYKVTGTFVVKNPNGLVLDIDGCSKNDNASLIAWTTNGGNNQKFLIEAQTDGSSKITASHSGKALTCLGDGKVVQSEWKNSDNQKWLIAQLDKGFVKFICKQNKKCLDIPGNSSKKGSKLQVYNDNGTNAQKFQLVQS